MMFKVGDEVFIKAEITDVHPGSERPYFVQPCRDSVNWVSKNTLYRSDGTYEQGIADAWSLAKKIVIPEGQDGLSYDVFEKVFGDVYTKDVFAEYTYEDCRDKIEAYEKEKKIKVGDVVTRTANGFNGIVTSIKNGEAHVMYDDGSTIVWSAKNLTKTGKHIDIESLLRQIGE